MYQQSDMERARAQAFSAAADTICNEWNRLARTRSWCMMSTEFQVIWKNLKNISDEYHKIADELGEKEQALRLSGPETAASIIGPDGIGSATGANSDS